MTQVLSDPPQGAGASSDWRGQTPASAPPSLEGGREQPRPRAGRTAHLCPAHPSTCGEPKPGGLRVQPPPPPAGFPRPALGAGTQTCCRCALHPAGLPEFVLWDRYYEKYAFFLRFLETASHGSSFLARSKPVKAARLLPVPRERERAPRPAVCSGGRCPPPGRGFPVVGGTCQPCCAGLHPTCDPHCAARLGGRRLAGHFCPHCCSQSSLPCTRHCPLPSGFPEHDVVQRRPFLPQQNKAP